MRKVLQYLRNINLQVDLKKSEFNIIWIKYPDFIIFIKGIEIDSEKVVVIYNWVYSIIIKGIQFFLEFYNFYYRFIHNFGILIKSLINLIKNNISFRFDNNCIHFLIF